VSNVILRRVKAHDVISGVGAPLKINRNNTISSAASYIYIESSDFSIPNGGNAIIDGVGVDHAVVRDCDIHDNRDGGHGAFFKGGSSDILWERNLVRNVSANAALQLGGDTGPTYFDPSYPNQEGVRQVARYNLIAGCDDSQVEVRGVQDGKILHNTIVTASTFAIFRLTNGQVSGGASVSRNSEIEIADNLVLVQSGSPQYARDDGGATDVTFNHQLWAGTLRNASSPGPAIPSFPMQEDVTVAAGALGSVLTNSSFAGLTGLTDAISRYTPLAGSPARSTAAPTIGALE
jgi:hypothetical protein